MVKYRIRVYGFFEVEIEEEDSKIAIGRAKQMILDAMRGQFLITNIQIVSPRPEAKKQEDKETEIRSDHNRQDKGRP